MSHSSFVLEVRLANKVAIITGASRGIGRSIAEALWQEGNFALLNLTKVLADRGIKDGVRVNAINPGAIATDRLRIRINKLAEEGGMTFHAASSRMAEQPGVSRFGEPSEIAAAVAFLASDKAGYCQGTILDLDGGQTKTL